ALAFGGIPTMDSLTLAFALEGVRALQLGRGGTDLLAVSLSATDLVGHAFGPDSREIHDQVLRLDRYLGWFLQQLLVRYTRESVLIVLTSDHGVTPFPERSLALGHSDAVRVIPDSVIRAVNAALDSRIGGHDWVYLETGMVLVPDRGKLAAQGVNVDSVVADLATRLRAQPGVVRVVRPADLAGKDTTGPRVRRRPHQLAPNAGGGPVAQPKPYVHGVVAELATRLRAQPGVVRVDRPADLAGKDTTDPLVRRWQHQIAPNAGVELVATLKPYAIWSLENLPIAMHGQPSDLDAHVPLLFWGRGVRRGVYRGRVSTAGIAPTLARLLGLTPSEPLDGRVLGEALQPVD